MMAILFLAKFVASSISLGCGAPGGVFGPVFFIGAMGGGATRALLGALMPPVTGVRGSYALVGSGRLSGRHHSRPVDRDLSAHRDDRQLRRDPAGADQLDFALVVARAIEPESIDTYALARRGISLEIDKDRLALSRIATAEVMNPKPAKLNAQAGLEEIFAVAEKSGREILPVVGSDGGLVGVIAARNLVGLLLHGQDLKNLVNAADVCRADFPTVTPKSSLEDALHLMEDELTGELPVVDTKTTGAWWEQLPATTSRKP